MRLYNPAASASPRTHVVTIAVKFKVCHEYLATIDDLEQNQAGFCAQAEQDIMDCLEEHLSDMEPAYETFTVDVRRNHRV
jgi:hypothetical protein